MGNNIFLPFFALALLFSLSYAAVPSNLLYSTTSRQSANGPQSNAAPLGPPTDVSNPTSSFADRLTRTRIQAPAPLPSVEAIAPIAADAPPQQRQILQRPAATRARAPSGSGTGQGGGGGGGRFPASPSPAAPTPTPCAGIEKSQFRTLDGTCNNLKIPTLGAARTPFVNLYLVRTPFVPRRRFPPKKGTPSARVVSNIVCNEDAPVKNDRNMAELVTFFGQFMDHTITETLANRNEPFPIQIPADDTQFTPNGEISFLRSIQLGEGMDKAPENELTHYVDGSSVYGKSDADAKFLRTKFRGRLRTSRGNFLPRNKTTRLFLAGDKRVNENGNLMSMHLLFVREHNRVSREVRRAFPYWGSDRIFNLTRHIVAAEIQAVLYYEWIPALTGSRLPRYKRYDSMVDPRIATEFSTVAYRVGHTLLNSTVNAVDRRGRLRKRSLRSSFFNVDAFAEDGFDNLVRGMLTGHASEVDNGITDEVRNFLITTAGSKLEFDLASLNIQRGRDHQVPTCNELRKSHGLPIFKKFSDVTKNTDVANRLHKAYNGDINAMDAWICGISEDHVKGSSLGSLFQTIIRDQFQRLRDGDRFYFERPGYFTWRQRYRIPTIRRLVGRRKRLGRIFKQIIVRNTNLRGCEVRRNPFFVSPVRPYCRRRWWW